MSNKLIITLSIILVSLIAFLTGYFFNQDIFTEQTANLGKDSVLDKFNSPSEQKKEISPNIFALGKEPALSPTLSKDKNSVIYYSVRDGRVFEYHTKERQERTVSETLLPDLMETIWSPNKKEVISIFSTDNGEQFRYFNYQTRKVFIFDPSVKSVAFSPDGSRLAYFWSQGINGAFYISNPDGSSPRKILDTRLTGAELYWPAQESIAFKVSENSGDSLYLLSVTGNLTKLISENKQLEFLFSPDGSRVLYSPRNNSSSDVYIKDLTTLEETPLQVSVSASKCVWEGDETSLICAIQRSGTGGDDIYRIEGDKTRQLIISPEKNIAAVNLMLTADEEFLILLNNLDGKLYAISIPK